MDWPILYEREIPFGLNGLKVKPVMEMSLLVCLFDLILNVPSTIFQLNRDGSSWVEPVLYLKPKVTLHCYYKYLFWVLVSGILNVFNHIKVQSIIHMTVEFHVFAVINATTML